MEEKTRLFFKMFVQAKEVINEKVLHKLLHYNCSHDQK